MHSANSSVHLDLQEQYLQHTLVKSQKLMTLNVNLDWVQPLGLLHIHLLIIVLVIAFEGM